VALHISIGNDAKNSGGYTDSVSGQFAALRGVFSAAQEGDDPTSPVSKVLNGTLPVIFHVHQADEIGSVIEFKSDFSLTNVAILGASEAAIVAQQLAEAGISVILSPALSFPAYFETRRSTDDDLGILLQAGVKTAISEFDPDWVRNIRWNAGYLRNNIGAKYGISQYTAISLITRNIAEIFNLPPGIGSITTGTPANFVLYDGDPLTTRTRVALNALGGYVQCYPQQK